MSAPSKKTKLLKLFLFLAFGTAFAAPDEDLLGKAQGYPVCKQARLGISEPHCLVGNLSHYDEVVPARVVKAASPRALKRSASAPQLSYLHNAAARNVESFLANNRNTGLLVMKGDTILVERYQYDRKAEDRFQSYSMAKTVVAMLVGVALSDKKISSIDDLAGKYVPELKGHPYGETRLRHLLTMSSGVQFREDYDGSDDVTLLARRTLGHEGPGGVDTVLPFTQRARPAGEKFVYASAESQVLALVVRNAVGKPLAEYLSEKIWRPMGAEADATWLVDAGGYELGYMGLNATLRDWGRLGALLANYGAVDGKQLIPAAWVKAMTTPDAPHLERGVVSKFNGYGYQTWLIGNTYKGFALFGVRGQSIFIDPETKLVIVHTAVHANYRDPARDEQFAFFFGALRSLKDKDL